MGDSIDITGIKRSCAEGYAPHPKKVLALVDEVSRLRSELEEARNDYSRELAAHGATIRERGIVIVERDEARRDLTEAIIRESEANRELGREQMRSEAARRERDEMPALRVLPGDFDHVGVDLWTRGTDDGSALERVQAAIDALRTLAAGSGLPGTYTITLSADAEKTGSGATEASGSVSCATCDGSGGVHAKSCDGYCEGFCPQPCRACHGTGNGTAGT